MVQTSTGLVLTALLWQRSLRPRLAGLLFAIAIWAVATLPDSLTLLHNLGAAAAPGDLLFTVRLAATLTTAALFLATPHYLGVLALVGQMGLYVLGGWLKQSDGELCSLHLAWFGLLLGAHALVFNRAAPTASARALPRTTKADAWLFGSAVAIASFVCLVVLLRGCDSADEWAYNFQADVFAKLHAWSRMPPCFPAFESYWVFWKGDHVFSQYTPGWPLFMAPFVALRLFWLAAPVSTGLLVVGVARLGRRVARGVWPRDERRAAEAGVISGIATFLSSTVLINGGSRFPHVFLCACFAWMVESLATLADQVHPTPHRGRWGAMMGLSAAWLLATRPPDGALLGFAAALYAGYLLVTGRLSWRPMLFAAGGFVFIGGLTLIILRLQLGEWFRTGYSLTAAIRSWSKFKMSVPKGDELRWGVPLQTGSYCWWPLTPALGLAGLTLGLRGRGRNVAFMLTMGVAPLLVFYALVEFGRGWDFGYGPRYELPVVVPMATGTGVALAPLYDAARRPTFMRPALLMGGPFVLAVAALLTGTLRLVPDVYPNSHEDVRARTTAFSEAAREGLHHAIVWIVPHTTESDPLDLTQNAPVDLYPNPDVLFLIDRGPEVRKCVNENFPGRRQYHTEGRSPLHLIAEQ